MIYKSVQYLLGVNGIHMKLYLAHFFPSFYFQFLKFVVVEMRREKYCESRVSNFKTEYVLRSNYKVWVAFNWFYMFITGHGIPQTLEKYALHASHYRKPRDVIICYLNLVLTFLLIHTIKFNICPILKLFSGYDCDMFLWILK